MMVKYGDAIDSLITVFVTDPRDWSLDPKDAWSYGIVVGWGNALPDVAKKLHWSNEDMTRLMSYHDAFQSIYDQGDR